MSEQPIRVPGPRRKPHFGPEAGQTYRLPVVLKTRPRKGERQRVRAMTRHEEETAEQVAEEVREQYKRRQAEHEERLKRDGWTQDRRGVWTRPGGKVRPPRRKGKR